MSQQATSAKKETIKKQGGSSRPKGSEPSFNMDELRELANLVNENGFTDFEFENANIRVRLSKNPAPQMLQSMPQQYAPAAALTAAHAAQSKTEISATAETALSETTTDENTHVITSPIVGTFYRSPAPDKEPYVKEGSNVSPDTIVCIVEAMKLMNEIEAEVAGEVVKIYVESGQPVEFGQPLFDIKK
jgi:acetyl-CoA carboxylase biotin carboxyl carrier protein